MSSSIKVGIIGAGKFSHRHLKAIQKIPGIAVVAACRSNPEALTLFCREYGLQDHTDYRKLLADPEVDAVLIATPHHLHAEIAIAAATAGKHILLEKPFATNSGESKLVNEQVERAGVKLMIGHTGRFTAAFMRAQEFLQSGELGSIVQVSATSSTFWMGPDRKAWHLDKRSGGGYLFTLGVHQLDAMMTLVCSKVCDVRATIGSVFHPGEVDDCGSIWMQFENGVTGSLLFRGFIQGITNVQTDLYCERAF